MTAPDFTFSVTRLAFDEDYSPAANTRITTNFANLARGEHRQSNLRRALQMMENRLNTLAYQDNPDAERYGLGLDIVSVAMGIDDAPAFPLIEMLQTRILDRQTGESITGILGNSFSSYLRDYDFSILLPQHIRSYPGTPAPADFGDLHGRLYKAFLASPACAAQSSGAPVICLSVSGSRSYRRSGLSHPVLGAEYEQGERSFTDQYFAKMGCQVRFFMPPGSVAPLAFYFSGDLLADYTSLELAGTIATMESFQKIYRPEIYNANSAAGEICQPSLAHEDFSLTRIIYDREERSRLALEQARFAEESFLIPHQARLNQWSASFAQ